MLVTMKEFDAMVEEEREKDERFWKGVRYIAFMQLTTAPYLKNKPKSPQHLFRLPSEIKMAPKIEVTQEIENGLKSIGLYEFNR